MRNFESPPIPGEEEEQPPNSESPEEPRELLERKSALEEAYAERQKTIEQRISELRQEIGKKRFEVGFAQKMIDNLEDRITVSQSKTLGKVFNFLEIQRLRKMMGIEQVKLEEAQKDFDTAAGLLKEMENQLADRRELEEVEKMISEFYKEQEELKKYEEEKRSRDVKGVSVKHNAVFSHAFAIPVKGEQERQVTVMREGNTLKDKLRVVLGLQPEISTKPLREGRPEDKPYHNLFGVLLRGGEIKGMGTGTTVRGTEREISKFSQKDFDEGMKGAGIEEVGIAKPEVAGFFYTSDTLENISRRGYDDDEVKKFLQDFFAEADKLGIPMYFQDLGKGSFIKRTDYDPEKGFFLKEEPATVQDILNNDFQLSEERRRSAREEIFEDCPFRLDMPERHGIDSLARGKSDYAEITDPDKINDFFDQRKRRERRGDEWVQTGSQLRIPGNWYSVETKCIDNKSYLNGLAEGVEARKKSSKEFYEERLVELETAVREGRISPEFIDVSKKDVEKKEMEMAFYIYGYGEAARETGDMETHKRAIEIAGKLISPEQYQDIINRRVGPDGKFKIKEEDLKYIASTR